MRGVIRANWALVDTRLLGPLLYIPRAFTLCHLLNKMMTKLFVVDRTIYA